MDGSWYEPPPGPALSGLHDAWGHVDPPEAAVSRPAALRAATSLLASLLYFGMNIEHNQLIDVYVGRPTPDAIECHSTIPSWAPIFEEHFPENPILPGALLVETMAQAAGCIEILRSDFSRRACLAAVKSAKFKAYARAGESLVIRARATHWEEHLMVCEADVSGADGRALAHATLKLKFEPFASDRMRQMFLVLLSRSRQAPCPADATHFSPQVA